MPEENYWYRRHLVVYEWIAERVRGERVIDMACGEGYGSDVLARHRGLGRRASTATPRRTSTRGCATRGRTCASSAAWSKPTPRAPTPLVFLQTIEHLQDPLGTLAHFRSLVGENGTVYVSTPNVLTLAPKGQPRSGNPWHVHEYRHSEFEQLCRTEFAHVEMFGLFHARKLRAHEIALRLGWDRVHGALGLTSRFYDRFTPAIRRRATSRCARPAGANLDRALDFLAVCRP